MKTTTETRRAAKKKTMPQTNAVQSDPWLAWCEPAQGEDAQRFLDNPMERLGMSVDDHLALMEMFYPSEILHSAEHTISKATSEAAIPKLEAIRVASTPDCEIDEDGTRTNDIPILAHTLTQQLPLFEIVEKVFSKLERIKEAWPHSAAVERLKKVAEDFVRLLLAVQRLGKEKIAQAKADGRIDAAAKLEKAYKDFCMIDLTGDIAKDAEQLFLVKKVTPDAFRTAMRSAFKLDREATDEINGAENATPTPQQVATATIELAPHYSKLLQQAADNSAAAKNAAEQTVVGILTANEKIDALSDWLQDWRKHAPHINRNNPPRTQISNTVRDKIVGWWEEYQSEPIDNSPKLPAINRKSGQKRSIKEFLEAWGDKKTYEHGPTHEKKTLNQLLIDARRDKEKPLETLKRLLDSARKNESRHPQNPAQN